MVSVNQRCVEQVQFSSAQLDHIAHEKLLIVVGCDVVVDLIELILVEVYNQEPRKEKLLHREIADLLSLELS